jgi:predicted permease
MRDALELPSGTNMEVADLVLPVFAIIVTGWLAGWLGYTPGAHAA